MSQQNPPAHIIFVNSLFPCLSETFIFDQFSQLKEHGLDFSIVSNHVPDSSQVHPRMRGIESEVFYLAHAPLTDVVRAHLAVLIRHPLRYVRALWNSTRMEERWLTTLKHITGAALIAQRYTHQSSPHIHAHFTYGGAAVALWCQRILDIPYTLTLHGADLIFDNPPDLAAKLAEARAIISISQSNVTYVKTHFPQVNCPLHVIPLGVPELPPPPQQPRQDVWRILNVGRLSEHKAQHVLIEACRLLREQGLKFNCRIVGEGPLRAALEDQIAAAQLSDCVELLGPRFHHEVLELYGDADVFALSSVTEGMPLVLMEAMRAGLPVVSTNVGAIAELIQDAGRLVPASDAAALAAALAELLSDAADIEQLRRRAQTIVSEQFNLTRNTQRFGATLLDIAANR